MTSADPIVVKLGGSLLELPGLGSRLRLWLDALPTRRVVLLVGGGPTADVIRTLDRIHPIGQQQAHWLAIRALSLNARVVAEILPCSQVVAALEDCSKQWALRCTPIIDPHPVLLADWGKPGELPHTWDVTSDSIAARMAELVDAQELILLKSCSGSPQADWETQARAGLVDAYFPHAVSTLPLARIVNFRELSEPRT